MGWVTICTLLSFSGSVHNKTFTWLQLVIVTGMLINELLNFIALSNACISKLYPSIIPSLL